MQQIIAPIAQYSIFNKLTPVKNILKPHLIQVFTNNIHILLNNNNNNRKIVYDTKHSHDINHFNFKKT